MKAIALISGGLDSTLSAKLIQEQGVEIVGLNFRTLFCHGEGKLNFTQQAGGTLKIELKIMDINKEFLEIIKKPLHGYGSNMNPCIDCRILAFKKAKEYMQEITAAFIITGEVVGQRPMSQHKQALRIIEKESGLEGLVLRPLSAKLLPETLPERKGWVSREKLLDFNGRTRKPQMQLAEKFHIKDYSTPAGGCLLTDQEFTKRIRDLVVNDELTLRNAELLKLGRHFRISQNTKLIVGRNKEENERLINLGQADDLLYWPSDVAGPVGLGMGTFDEEMIRLCSQIICRYCDLNGRRNTDIIYKRVSQPQERVLNVSPLEETQIISLRI
jgi:tRNA-specific 2-thiouridylase